MRKRFALLSALAACSSAPSTPNEDSARPPNIVFVLTDDQGYGDATSHGHPSLRTPHIDSLVRDGMRFTQFATAACVCTPSRAAFLTGCYAKRLGLHERVIFPETGRRASARAPRASPPAPRST